MNRPGRGATCGKLAGPHAIGVLPLTTKRCAIDPAVVCPVAAVTVPTTPSPAVGPIIALLSRIMHLSSSRMRIETTSGTSLHGCPHRAVRPWTMVSKTVVSFDEFCPVLWQCCWFLVLFAASFEVSCSPLLSTAFTLFPCRPFARDLQSFDT